MMVLGLVCFALAIALLVWVALHDRGRNYIIDPKEHGELNQKDKEEGMRVNWKQPP